VINPTDIADPVAKLAYFTRNAKQILATTSKERSKELGIRISQSERRMAKGFARGETGEQILPQAVRSLKGELPAGRFTTPGVAFTDTDKSALMQTLKEADLGWADNLAAIRGLLKVYGQGVVPQPAEIRVLQKVYGSELVRAIQSQRPKPEIIKQALTEMLNLPRAIMASADMSAPLRQGATLAPGFPKEFGGAIKPMVRAWGDEAFAKDLLKSIDDEATLIGAKKAGVDFTDINSMVFEGREEAFLGAMTLEKLASGSALASTVRASERAYVVFLNKLRLDVYKSITKNWDTKPRSHKEYRKAADFVNHATGRGKLPGALGKSQPLLNAAFFAPQLVWSRVALGGDFVKALGDPALRVPVARSVGAFVGTGLAALYMMQKSGMAEVELDPRSSAFGKVKVGTRQYDFWAGYQPIARYFAQALTGQQKTSSGNIVGVDRSDTVLRFLRSKLSPVAGLAVDVSTGESFLGEQLRADTNTFEEQVVGRLTPLFIQDVIESIQEENSLVGGLAAAPAFLGAGFANFSTIRDRQNIVAEEIFGKDYRDATGAEQQIINQDPRVVDKQAEFDLRESDYGTEIDRLETLRTQSEQILAAELATGSLGPKDFADALGNVQQNVSQRKDESRRNFEIPDVPAGSPLQEALSGFYDLYRQADRGYAQGVETGILDWELYDQLEHDYNEALSPEQKDFVEQRKRTLHDPSVQWYYDQRDIVSGSGYYDQNDVAFNKLRARMPQGIDSFGDLIQERNFALVNGDTRTAANLTRFISRVQKVANRQKQIIRRRNPEVDIALILTGRVTKPQTRQARVSLQENGFPVNSVDNLE
jgi:hypothetical protein